MSYMYSLVFLVLIVPSSLMSLEGERNSDDVVQHRHCTHDSECPTWFTCNSSSMCQCGDMQNHAVACDEKLLMSAVLNCYCVTYDNKSRSTFLGLCFYNCDSHKKSLA